MLNLLSDVSQTKMFPYGRILFEQSTRASSPFERTMTVSTAELLSTKLSISDAPLSTDYPNPKRMAGCHPFWISCSFS
jgi:hypothetical protein